MEIIKIVSIGFLTILCSLTVKQVKPEFSVLITIAGGCIVFLMILELLSSVLWQVNEFLGKIGLNSELFAVLIKIVGIGYITEFASSACSDAQNSSMASKIELAGKVLILASAMPIFKSLFDVIVELIP